MYTATCMNEVRRNNELAGRCFFHPLTMNYWRSKIETELLANNTFVTSEKPEFEAVRKYSVRYYNPETAQIETIGEHGQFESCKDAIFFAKSFSKT